MPDDPCQPIRELIASMRQDIRDHEELLAETPASSKPAILAIITREKEHVAQLSALLMSCEKARRS
jgi:hypothetical protein